LIKALAIAGRPEQAVSLLKQLDVEGGQAGVDSGVLHTKNLYLTLLTAITNRLELKPTNTMAAKLAAMADGLISRMGRHGVKMTHRLHSKYAYILASQGKYDQVEAMIQRASKEGFTSGAGAVDYSPLVRAFGVAGEKARINSLKRMMVEKGGSFTRNLWISMLIAYGDCEDGESIRQTWKEMVMAGVEDDMGMTTTYMYALEAAGEEEEAWKVFEEWRKEGKPVDEVMFGAALKVAMPTGGKERLMEVYKMAVGVLGDGDLRIVNSLLHGFTKSNDVESALGVLDDIRARGLKPNMFTYSVVIQGLSRVGRWGEAMDLAEEAKKLGLTFDAITIMALQRSPLRNRGQEILLNSQETAEDHLADLVHADGKEVVIDLHGLTVVETEALLSREFTKLRQSYEAARAVRRTKVGEEEVEGNDDGLRDLVIITGIGRNSRVKGQSVLRAWLRDQLVEKSIHYHQPEYNQGRFVIPKTSLREHFDGERKKEEELHFFRMSLFRYIPVASLLVMSMVINQIRGALPM